MSEQYKVGLVAGYLMAAVCIIAVFMLGAEWKKGREQRRKTRLDDFDERQEIVRGKAAQYALLTLMVYNFLIGVSYSDRGPGWCNFYILQMVGMAISASIFSVYCIWKEAYLGLREKSGRVYLITGGLGIFHLIVAVMEYWNGNLFVDGRVTDRAGNLILGLMFFLNFVVILLRNLINRRKMEQER
ncbi:MAG: hypothetical protein ACLT3H_00465 [Roseburia sp.]